MVPDGKGGMQLVQMPMVPPGWTLEGMAEIGGSAEGVTDGTDYVEQSEGDRGDLSIGVPSNAEVAEGALAAPLENGTAE